MIFCALAFRRPSNTDVTGKTGTIRLIEGPQRPVISPVVPQDARYARYRGLNIHIGQSSPSTPIQRNAGLSSPIISIHSVMAWAADIEAEFDNVKSIYSIFKDER